MTTFRCFDCDHVYTAHLATCPACSGSGEELTAEELLPAVQAALLQCEEDNTRLRAVLAKKEDELDEVKATSERAISAALAASHAASRSQNLRRHVVAQLDEMVTETKLAAEKADEAVELLAKLIGR